MHLFAKFNSTKKICLIVVLLYFIIALLSNFIKPYSVNDISFDALLSPSNVHILGTDELGHDIFSLLINGFKISIFIAILSGIFSTVIGTFLAVIACYYKGKIDYFLLNISNFFIIIPEIIIIMFFAVYATPTITNTIIAIVFFSWSKVFKITRSKLLAYMNKNKVIYTLSINGNIFDVLKKLQFDLYPVIITNFILQCNKAVMYETTLSFFGIGDPLAKTWGKLIKAGMNYENLYYDNVFLWYLLPPVLCVFIFVLALSLLTFEEN